MELTVVIALISVMLFVALPRVKNNLLVDQTKKTSRWLITSVRQLKEASIRDQVDYMLNVDIENGKFWISSDSISVDTLSFSEDDGFSLGNDVRILDVSFQGNRKTTDSVAIIHFYAKGYSDNAMIHLEDEDDRQTSYHVSPFLYDLEILEGYIDLESL